MKKYFIHTGKEHIGPLDLDELKTKGITKETPVWYKGLDEWTDAGKLEELTEFFDTITPPPYRKPVKDGEHLVLWRKAFLAKIEHVSMWRWIQILSVIILVIFLFGKYADDVSKQVNWRGRGVEATQTKRVPTQKEIEQSTPTRFLTTQGAYKQTFWGHKIKIRGTVKSNATKAVYKDVVVRVISFDSSQKELSRQDFTLNDTVKPHSEIIFDFKIDKVANLDTITWKIVQAKPLE